MAAGLTETSSGNRVQIGFFGLRNAGKSSLVNAIAGQALSIVSEVRGTTTDPVKKAMELLPLGPVLLIDTPGLDDEGELGALRVERALRTLDRCDVAVLAVDSGSGLQEADRAFLKRLETDGPPCLIVYTKADLTDGIPACSPFPEAAGFLSVSAVTGQGIPELKERLASMGKPAGREKRLIGDLLKTEDVVALVTPIDASAPKGRLILPQVQTIRDILDAQAICVTARTEQLPALLSALRAPPKLVITDSQDFATVRDMIPEDLPLTSFSILMARFKGMLRTAAAGARRVDTLRDGDTVLISEGCTHHRQCQDIGTVKLPAWLRRHTGKDLCFQFTSGGEFPADLSPYALVIHCGGCMLGEREVLSRLRRAEKQSIPFTNYGTAIAHMNGILSRALEPFAMERGYAG